MASQSIKEILETTQNFKEEVSEIYKVINEDVENQPTLSTINSTSKVAEFRLWEYVFAALSWLQQKLWDSKKEELQQAADDAPTCNTRWFAIESKLFQYGDTLLFDEVTRDYYYAVEDLDKQIIKRVSVVDSPGQGLVKVAKETDGIPEELTIDELNAFKAFIKRIQPIGSNISVLSQAADTLNLPITITYDAIIPVDDVTADVESAINEYLTAIDFTGAFRTIDLIDKIQDVEGVVDVEPGQFQAKYEGGIMTDFDRSYNPVSGYFKIDDASPLSTTITYQV